ncbi:uncharacterized protein I206_104299 [Kwoniella pini CBS 10737]|uniref:Uncharacterized protein n=1 Tax=Kwoniella pini CBS 10737 TaxID=1296096 RepID=A0A1B9I234_9TREE|nr:uncharacterized protein I206_04124 [Kwoniella pini CBS 10737]OCF49602.1 hypothetical protein I206_04124 [Kwoniella pini CBS 10737]
MPRLPDERKLAPLPRRSTPTSDVGLSCLADAALADWSTLSSKAQRQNSITLPSISSIIYPSLPTAKWEGFTASLPSLGIIIPSSTNSLARSDSLQSASTSDQPVASTSNIHISSVSTPFPPLRPSKKAKLQKRSHDHSGATPNSVQLEYNVRPYNRTAAPSNPFPAPSQAYPSSKATRQPKAKLPHPLQGLALDKTHSDRKVEDWQNAAQNLLHPLIPIPPLSYSGSSFFNHHSAAQSLISPPAHTLKKVHPPIDS